MDLFATEQLNGKLWTFAKQAALMCFLVACVLLGTSLVLWQPEVGIGQANLSSTVPPWR